MERVISLKGYEMRVPDPRREVSRESGGQTRDCRNPIGDAEKHYRLSLLYSVAVISVVLTLCGQPTQAEGERSSKALRMGYSSKLYNDVDIRDAQVAMDMLTAEMNRIVVGGKVFSKATVFQDTTAMIEAIDRREIDTLTLTTLDYLRMKNKLRMTPFLTAANHVNQSQQRLLVVRKERGITKVTQLEGKAVAIPSCVKDEISSMWLDILLAREGIREKERYFRQVKEVNKASQAVLPVFFKQTDSAIVTRSAFELISALNPQLKEDLFILDSSKSLLGGVFCVHENLDESLKKLLFEQGPKLNESTTGRQILTLLQSDRIIPFQPEYMNGVIELEKEHQYLSARIAGRR